MLKIKDNVNLKILERYGFEEIGACYEKSLPNPLNEGDDTIKLIIYFKILEKGIYKTRNIYIFVDEFSEWDNLYNIDILFDLIQAGLVERVSD